ncbi:hypothetical protein BDY24DRAFT_356208 [Mrakia frigida]|uniref:uncharacterized protein n=1 Tax=Mrakia frigida TaxID=29902 RepID=UPI003FCC0C28
MKRSPPAAAAAAEEVDEKDPSLVPANKRRKPNLPDQDEPEPEPDQDELSELELDGFDAPPAKLEEEEDLPAGTFKRRRLDNDDDDDAEADELDDDDDERAGEVADGRGTQAVLSEEVLKRLATRGADGFLPGSIVRIALKNFMTFKGVEFRCGPGLNSVIAPNGSGKSSIVCALAIGLGWSPNVLGRGDRFDAFIRTGAKKGYTEIELKSASDDEPNLVIRRDLTWGKNTTTFWLNDYAVTAKTIREKVTALNIQIGNLCSFMPQERVAQFAEMSPQELLRQTQKAAGPAQMTEWHEKLIELTKEGKEVGKALETKTTEVERRRAANERLQAEVKDAEERKELASQIFFLEHIIPWSDYAQAKDVWNESRDARKRLHAVWRTAATTLDPYSQLEAHFVELETDEKDKIKKYKEKASTANDNLKRLKSDIKTLADDKDVILENFDNQENRRAKKKKLLETKRKVVAKLEKSWEKRKLPKEVDEDALRRKVHDAQVAVRDLEERLETEVDDERTKIRRAVGDKKAQIARLRSRINQLQSVSNARMQNLRKWPTSEGVIKLVQIIRKDKAEAAEGKGSMFKMEVFEPPCLCVSVKQMEHASRVEATIPGALMRTVVVQCQEDYDMIGRMVDKGTRGPSGRIEYLQANWTLINTPYRPRSGPVPHEQLLQMGFDGYAIDFIDAPDPVKEFLESNGNLHRNAISSRILSEGSQLNTINYDVVRKTRLTNYIAGNIRYSNSNSRYGAQLSSASTVQISPARSFKNVVDQNAIDEAYSNIASVQEDINKTPKMLEQLDETEAELKTQIEEAKHASDKAKKAVKSAQDLVKANFKNKLTLDNQRKTLDELENAPSEEESNDEIRRELRDIVKEKLKLDLQYMKTALVASRTHQSLVDTSLAVFQLQENIEEVQAQSKKTKKESLAAKKTYDMVTAKVHKLREKALALNKKAEKKLMDLPSSESDRVLARIEVMTQEGEGSLPQPRVLHEELLVLTNELDALGGEDPAVLEKFRRAENLLSTLEKDQATLEQRQRTITKNITSFRGKWLPELRKLVANFNKKFSASMDALDNRGEIRIKEDEDYNEWAIEILVSFRGSQAMEVLTSHHQSGGERSLTTIMYLLSCIELANTPFTVVDEINQGMDSRAERAVHNQLVAVTSNPANAGQFFLFTPKLLEGLDYDPGMRVLVVFNGEWLPLRKTRNDTDGKNYISNLLSEHRRIRNY